MSVRTVLLLTAAVPILALNACAVGPNYKRPSVETPPAFKEAAGWAPAKPADAVDKGDWWSMFDDPLLDSLERKVNVSNQTIIADEAAYREARALVSQQRASLFPVVTATGSATRQHQPGDVGAWVTSSGQVVTGKGEEGSMSSRSAWAPPGRRTSGARSAAPSKTPRTRPRSPTPPWPTPG